MGASGFGCLPSNNGKQKMIKFILKSIIIIIVFLNIVSAIGAKAAIPESSDPNVVICNSRKIPVIGLKKSELDRLCWGEPIEKSVMQAGNHLIETYIYGFGFLIFDNGVLKSYHVRED